MGRIGEAVSSTPAESGTIFGAINPRSKKRQDLGVSGIVFMMERMVLFFSLKTFEMV
jgi:hypothetical protein